MTLISTLAFAERGETDARPTYPGQLGYVHLHIHSYNFSCAVHLPNININQQLVHRQKEGLLVVAVTEIQVQEIAEWLACVGVATATKTAMAVQNIADRRMLGLESNCQYSNTSHSYQIQSTT